MGIQQELTESRNGLLAWRGNWRGIDYTSTEDDQTAQALYDNRVRAALLDYLRVLAQVSSDWNSEFFEQPDGNLAEISLAYDVDTKEFRYIPGSLSGGSGYSESALFQISLSPVLNADVHLSEPPEPISVKVYLFKDPSSGYLNRSDYGSDEVQAIAEQALDYLDENFGTTSSVEENFLVGLRMALEGGNRG